METIFVLNGWTIAGGYLVVSFAFSLFMGAFIERGSR